MGLTQIDDRGLKTPIDLLDSEKIRFGTGTDLEIYSGGAGGKIHCNNGVLEIESDSFQVWNHAANEAIAKFTADAGVELYYNNSKKLETTNSGILLGGSLYANDNTKLILGTGEDFKTYHNGTNTYMENGTGNLIIDNGSGVDMYINSGNDIYIRPQASENGIKVIGDGAVELYHDASKKFETYSDGIKAYDDVWLPDDGIIRIGSRPEGGDLHIYHDASHSYIYNITGELKLRAATFKVVNSGNSEVQIKATENGAVELYYDNVAYLKTASFGVNLTNGADLYLNDSGQIKLGDSQDLLIYHDGSNSYIQNNTGNFQITCDEFRVKTVTGTETVIQSSYNGDVQLYYDNLKRFETTADGCTIQKGITVKGEEGGIAQIRILADEGDDNADTWRLVSQTNGNFDIESHYTDSWVTAMGIRINSQDNPCIQAPKGGIKFDIDNPHTTANFGSIDGDGHLARVDGHPWLTADDYFRIRDLDNAEDKRFEFNTDSGNAGALNDWQDDQFDFAEMFEWSDGNPNDEDRIGHTVAIDGLTGKIKIAQTGDTVIGVVSGTAAFTANCAGLYWHNAYLRDEWGRYQYNYIKDEDGNTVYNDAENGSTRPKKKLKKNPDWDQERSYHRRTDRREWDKIGIIGQCYVRKTAVIPSGWIKLKEIDSKKDFYLIK